MEFENFLERVGVDAEETLKRFAGRSDILEKFLLKFPEDPVYGAFLDSVAEKAQEEMERNLHTLKGVTGNLGLKELHRLSSEELQRVRAQHSMPSAKEMREIRYEYDRVVMEIKEYRGQVR